MIIVLIVGLAVGAFLGVSLNISYPAEYSFYVTMGLLAALDSLLGAVRSWMEGKYRGVIFISGFVVNTIVAVVLVYLGDRLGIPLYYAAIFIFGGRLFQNLSIIRRIIIDRISEKKYRENNNK